MDIGCIILAGGRSTRMGADKAQMLVDDRRLVDHALDSLPHEWDTVIVSPLDLGRPTVTEDPPYGGPVAGISAGLQVLDNPLVAVMAVDAPHSGRMLRRLLAALGDDDVAVATTDGYVQPLCAVWKRNCLESALEQVGDRDVAAKRLIAAARNVTYIPGDGSEVDYDTPDALSALGAVSFPHQG